MWEGEGGVNERRETREGGGERCDCKSKCWIPLEKMDRLRFHSSPELCEESAGLREGRKKRRRFGWVSGVLRLPQVLRGRKRKRRRRGWVLDNFTDLSESPLYF